MKIIGLTALKGAGKDTMADFLVSNNKFVKISFAQFMKDASKILFDWTDEHFEHDNKEIIDKYWGISPRQFLQNFGTEFLRGLSQLNSTSLCIYNSSILKGNFSFHIKRLNLHINKLYKNKINNIVITDIRFQDEFDFIKQLGGIIVKINRDISSNEYSNHLSETFINDFKEDFIIYNNSSKEEFYKHIQEFLRLNCS